jgi:hypothetical protein
MQLPTDHRLSGPPEFWSALVVLLLFAVAAVLLRSGKPWLERIQRKPLMTENEKSFFRTLQRALPGHQVFPQVSFAAFLTDDGKLPQQKRWAVRNRFDRKIADFVVCDRNTMEIVAIVELDDRTHSAAKDRYRDELTKAAGYQTIRFQSRQKPTEAEIAALFKHSEALSVSKLPDTPARVARR